MRKILLIAKLCPLFIVLFLFGCRKHDTLPNENSPEYKKQVTEKFFTVSGIIDPSVTKVINKLKQYPDYFPAFVKRNGFAKWDKAVVIDLPKQRGEAAILNDMTTAAAANNPDAHIALIPLLKDGDKQVKNMLAIKVIGDSIRGSVIRSANYKWYDQHAAQQGINGSQLSLLFMKLDEQVFGHTRFAINDSTLFKSNNKKTAFIDLKGTQNNSQQPNSAPELTEQVLDSYEYICVYITVEKEVYRDEGQVTGCPGGVPDCPHTVTVYVTEEYCNWGWVYGGTGGGGNDGGNTGNPGNPSGDPDPWGTGGPGGGGNPGGTGEPPIDDPCAGGGSGVDPRDPGSGGGDQPPCTDLGGGGNPPWTPVPPATLPMLPSLLESDNSPYRKDVTWGGSRIYVLGNGVAVEFPDRAKLRHYENIDTRILPNGALYGFELDGKVYVSIQEAFLAPGGLTVPAPKYRQFFEVDPLTNRVDRTKPMPENLLPVKTPDPVTNEPIKAVRLRVEKLPNGKCQLVREVVSYTPSPTTPTTVNGGDNMEYEINYAPVVPGSPVEVTPLENCPGASTPSSDPSKNLNTFLNSEESTKVANFLKNNSNSDTKIYLTDLQTNKVTHTITKDGVAPVPAGQQDALMNKFTSGTLGSGDEEIAIKAGILDGVWYYETKLNYTRLGNIPQKMSDALTSVVAEIKQQADEEVERLRQVGSRGQGEQVIVNGERFFKAGMGLLESLAAIWDLGKHMIKNGAVPESIWDDGTRSGATDAAAKAKYDKSPITTAAFLSGGTDQFFEDATGAVQLVATALEIARNPRQAANGVYEAVKNLSREKIMQLFNDLTGITNYNLGGKRAAYQGGRHSVQAATIFFTAVKLLAKANKLRKAGTEMIEIQNFIPDGSPNHPASNAFRNAAENNFEVRKIDDDKILTSNKINNQDRAVVVDRHGDVYEAKVINNLDEIDDEVLKYANASELAQAADDPTLYDQMKNHIINFINGKKFEKRIIEDPTTITSVGNKAGINLSTYDRKLTQVQLKTSSGDYFVADEVYIKFNGTTGKYDVVVNEIKISDATPFTKRQNEFLTDLKNGQVDFELRNVKYDGTNGSPNIPQGATFNIKAMIKSAGDGTVNGTPSFSKFDPTNNTWN